MITLDQYVGAHINSPDWNEKRRTSAIKFLSTVNLLMTEMEASGVVFPNSPKTGTRISGEKNGYGGFRPQNCTQGASNSSHKDGRGCDIYDPKGLIDAWLQAHPERLVFYGIYIEHPTKTVGWSHWSDRPSNSGNHIFYP